MTLQPLEMQSSPGPETVLDGRSCLYFAGTGYLGLQSDPRLVAAARDACDRWGIHTATTRGGYGTCPPVSEVERRAAEFFAAERGLYLVTGYAVNQVLAAALARSVDVCIIDESSHDCLREAARHLDQLRRPPLTLRHCDPDHLDQILRRELLPTDRVLLMTDGVFAASGRLAPLATYLQILDRYPSAKLLVDDAHGTAVLGDRGRGSLELAGVPPVRINQTTSSSHGPTAIYHGSTLSKAVGGQGGMIAGSAEFHAALCAASGWFRGASAPAAPVAAATARGLQIVQTEPRLRVRLAENVKQLREGIDRLGLTAVCSPAPIVSFELETPAAMRHVQQWLFESGIAIAYTQNYAGVSADGMLRIAVFATHTSEMIEQLLDSLRRVV